MSFVFHILGAEISHEGRSLLMDGTDSKGQGLRATLGGSLSAKSMFGKVF